MSVEKRPYVGTWRLSGQKLVQMTPDALVYLNGSTSVPGCSKCNGKIDIQQFLTEVSVDAGTEPGSASATFSLSIPLHHTDSFARDAKFIIRPGLEVHVYMRGYFPVAGLYSNLGESQSKTNLEGALPISASASPVESTVAAVAPETVFSRALAALSPAVVPKKSTFKNSKKTGATSASSTAEPEVLQAQVGPSLLEEMGMAGMGVEDTLAYPYYHVFHGVVTEATHSYSGGVSTISVSCSSILHFWQFHNMSTNASVFGARPLNSKNKTSLVGHNFTGMHPYAIMYSLHYDMAGAAGGVGWALSSKSNQAALSQGGESLFSLNIRYWEERFRRGTKLRMHGATGELFSTMAAAWLSRNSSGALSQALRARYNDTADKNILNVLNEAKMVGLVSGKGKRNAIEATRLAALSKPDATKNAPEFEINILEMQAFVSDIGNWGQINLFESTYEPKLDIANKVCDITGFEFYQDVDGDFVFKPPMWNLDTSSSRVYRIEDIDLINISFSEKEAMVTYMTVKGSQFRNTLGTGMENEWGVRGQYIDYRLVAQFGWRPGSYETNYFNDSKSMFFAAVNRMDALNIGINTASVTIPVRPELRPGYPVYIPYLDCFYYCNSFAHSHSVGGQCTTSLQLVGKRAKFYAPGQTKTGAIGIDAIRLGDTKLPERPLGVIGTDGKPRLSGFPNVVMALDPTAINPLFFVVGMDIENITDVRVVKYMLAQAVTDGVIFEEGDQEGSKKFYTMTHTVKGEDGESTSVQVRFFFDESDAAPLPNQSTGDVNIMAGAVAYAALKEKQSAQLEANQVTLQKIQYEIDSLYREAADIANNPLSKEGSQVTEYTAKRAQKIQDALNKEKAKNAMAAELDAAKVDLEKSWEDPLQGSGVGVLLTVYNRTSEKYRSSADFQGKGGLSSTVNLLDMLSDKKATFSNGQQPGQYRYYSASHPDIDSQGPRVASYNGEKRVVEDGPPAGFEAEHIPPVVQMYSTHITAPFPGAAIPEAALVPNVPKAGIRVLIGDPRKPGGAVLATNEITEVMFSVQDVTVVKRVTTDIMLSQVTGLGKAADKRIQDALVSLGQAEGSATGTLKSIYTTSWDQLVAKVQAAIVAAQRAAQAVKKPVLLALGLPVFPATVQVWSKKIGTSEVLGTYKYAGSEGKKSLGPQGSKATIGQFAGQAGVGLASSFIQQTHKATKGIIASMRKAGASPEEQEQVASAFREGLLLNVPVKTTTRGKGTKTVSNKTTSFSPVFPVSDGQGYHVIGSYRYGRDVGIDPEGVFSQMHQYDIFSLLDRNLVEKILRVFIQGKSIKVPKMEEIDAGNGQTKWVPVGEVAIGGKEAEKQLNDEALQQLRAANLTDKQILDFSLAISKSTKPGQLDFSLANYFSDSKMDGVQKIPVNNAAYSLADLNFQQSGHVCECKAAEANVQLLAFGQEQFVSLTQSGNPAKEGLGGDPSDSATRWVAAQSELAAAQWAQQQQALRGQVLDRGGSIIVPSFLSAFGIDTAGASRPDPIEKALAASAKAKEKFEQEAGQLSVLGANLSRSSEEDL